jgi:hypothetical protein
METVLFTILSSTEGHSSLLFSAIALYVIIAALSLPTRNEKERNKSNIGM